MGSQVKHCCLLTLALASIPALCEELPAPQVPAVAAESAGSVPGATLLAEVLERDFMISYGASIEGTLGVGHVRYALQLIDHWGQGEATPGTRLDVADDGSCRSLMQLQARYLVTLTQHTVASGDRELPLITCGYTAAEDAAEAIAALNQLRAPQPL